MSGPGPRAEILGRLLALPGVLEELPDNRSMGRFLAGAFEEIPGVHRAYLCIEESLYPEGLHSPCETCPASGAKGPVAEFDVRTCSIDLGGGGARQVLPLSTNRATHGAVLVVEDETGEFPLYRPYVVNIANMLATVIENRRVTEELRRARDSLEESRRFMSAVLESVADSIVACDEKGILRLFNQASRDLHGLPEKPVPASDWAARYRLYHADGVTPMAVEDVPLYRALQGEEVMNVEMVVRSAPEEQKLVLATGRALMDEEGRRLGAVVSLHDITARRKAELEHSESERRLQTLVNNIPGIVYRCANDVNWTMEFFSEGAIVLTGYPNSAFVGNAVISYADLIHPDDRDRVWDDVQKAVRTRALFDLVYRIRTAAGEEKWVWERGQGVFSDQGDLLALEGVIFDVTEKRRAEDELREAHGVLEQRVAERTRSLESSNEGLRKAEMELRRQKEFSENLIRAAHVIILLLSPDGRIVGFNPYMEELSGYRLEEVKGKDWFETFIVAEDGERIHQVFERAVAGVGTHGVVNRILTKDGRMPYIEWYDAVIRDETDAVSLLLAVGHDITDRLVVEDKLRRERDFSRHAINSLPGVFYLIGEDGRFLLWNDNLEAVTGYTAAELSTKVPTDLFGGDDRKLIAEWIARVFVEGDGRVEAHLESRTGVRHPFYFTGRRIEIDGGRALIGTGIDISERKHWERAVVSKSMALERSNEELKQFAYVASHDLQEPLNLIAGYLGLLAEQYRGRLDGEADEFIGYTLDGVARMKSLIKDLLAYSRIESQGKPFLPVDLNEAFSEALANLRARVEGTGARVASGVLPTVEADHPQIVRLFQNVIGNAIKFRRPNVSPEIEVLAHRRDGEWVVSLRDNGIGIPQEGREKIFVIFQRLHPRHDYPGTGIGLSICKRIVDRHGGRIWVESSPGLGSTFFFSLPLERGDEGLASLVL